MSTLLTKESRSSSVLGSALGDVAAWSEGGGPRSQACKAQRSRHGNSCLGPCPLNSKGTPFSGWVREGRGRGKIFPGSRNLWYERKTTPPSVTLKRPKRRNPAPQSLQLFPCSPLAANAGAFSPVAYLRRSSPGPRELGTITLTAALPLAQLIFCTTWEWPWAEKPKPPCEERTVTSCVETRRRDDVSVDFFW